MFCCVEELGWKDISSSVSLTWPISMHNTFNIRHNTHNTDKISKGDQKTQFHGQTMFLKRRFSKSLFQWDGYLTKNVGHAVGRFYCAICLKIEAGPKRKLVLNIILHILIYLATPHPPLYLVLSTIQHPVLYMRQGRAHLNNRHLGGTTLTDFSCSLSTPDAHNVQISESFTAHCWKI